MAENRIEELFRRAINIFDLTQAYELKIQFYMAKNQMQKSDRYGIKGDRFWRRSYSKFTPSVLQVNDLMRLPEITDPRKICAMRILRLIVDPAYGFNATTFRQIVLTMVNLCLQHGNCSLSAYSYAVYSWLLCGQFSNIELAYQFSQLSLQLPDRYNSENFVRKSSNYLMPLFSTGKRIFKKS